MQKTIAAISTPRAAGGIGVIRISGADAHQIAAKVFQPAFGKKIEDMEGYTALYGKVYDGNLLIDEAVLLKFRAPKSYTGENVAEISCHGGLYVTERVLSAVLKAGALLASAGEFTKRAFLNGKLDLTQAEAVSDLICAESETAARAALAAREGALSNIINQVNGALLNAAANMAAYVDYPDEDIPDLKPSRLKEILTEQKDRLEGLISGFEANRILKEGVNTVIAGRPNVGKSTLMNLLSGYEKSIVTEIEGTTRDVVEETVILGGLKLRLFDTAGLRDTEDIVEKIGVDRAKAKMNGAELILAVFDASQELDSADKGLIEEIRQRPVIAVINKSDLQKKLDEDYIKSKIDRVIFISAKKGEGLLQIESQVKELTKLRLLDPSAANIATERQKDCARRAYNALDMAIKTLDSGLTPDAVSVDLDIAIGALNELVGKRVTEAVTESVFEQFCVGK